MGQEFIIKSQVLEDKINQLLPSQGGFQAGVDLSASTTVIPIVDLTETAEGSDVRADLQTALSHTTSTEFNVNDQTTTVLNTTGYYRIFGYIALSQGGGGAFTAEIRINDGATDKVLLNITLPLASVDVPTTQPIDFIVFLKAGDSLVMESTQTTITLSGVARQIADVNGNLIDP